MKRILVFLLALLLVVTAFAATGVVRAHAPPITGAPDAAATILSAPVATDSEPAMPVLDLRLLLSGAVAGIVFSLWYILSKHYNLDTGRPARNAVITLLNHIAGICAARGILQWRGWSLPIIKPI